MGILSIKNIDNRFVLFMLLFLIILSTRRSSAQKLNIATNKTLYLNGIWHFKIDPNRMGIDEQWYQMDEPICGWDSLAVPGNWNLQNRHADYVGSAWYRRSFKIPEKLEGKALRLVFESTYYYAKFWLNGEYLGNNQFGLLPVHFNIRNKVRYNKENVLVVEVDNAFKVGALWNWGGIRRPVWIEASELQRLDFQHITAIPNLKKGNAKVNIKVKMENLSEAEEDVDARFTILYNDNVIAEKWQNDISLSPEDVIGEVVNFSLNKKDVHLWSFNYPNLYHSRIELFRDGHKIHSIKGQFGIRKIEVDGYDLKLNGEVVRPVGFNWVPEDRTTGNTLPLWRIKEDIDMMKSLGTNMARISHFVLPEAALDYLDQKGIMVFSEVSLWGKNRMVNPDSLRPKKWLDKLIQTQYNHPCIIGWSVGNEIGYVKDNPHTMEYVKSAIHHAKKLDSNRLAVYVSHSAAAQKRDPVEYENIILFNKYENWGKDADKVHQLYPGKPVFYSEFGENIVDEDPDKGVIDASKMLNDIRGRKYLIGAALWTFNDYRSNYTGTGPSENRAWGVVNVFRQPKRAYYVFKKEFAPVKKLEVETKKDKESHIKQLKITIEPRSLLDIPAYKLSGYKIIWTVLDKKEKITDGGWITLPDIYPGEKSFSEQINIQKYSDKNAKMKVSLVSPQMYAVLDTTIYLAAPSIPQIKAVYSSSRTVRIVYDKVPDAKGYKIIYNDGAQADTTKSSIDDFIEINHLEKNKKYTFKVVAENNYGMSQPSSSVKAKLNEDELPPVIWKTIPANHAFYIGYSSDAKDFLYDVEYGTSSGSYDHHLIVKNRGTLKVPNLKNGETYYYRLRSNKQWGFKSEWSSEYSVTPDGGLPPPASEVKGIVKKKKEGILCFNPVPKAVGYHVIKKSDTGKDSSFFVNGNYIHYVFIRNIGKKDTVFIQAINKFGRSTPKKVRWVSLSK